REGFGTTTETQRRRSGGVSSPRANGSWIIASPIAPHRAPARAAQNLPARGAVPVDFDQSSGPDASRNLAASLHLREPCAVLRVGIVERECLVVRGRRLLLGDPVPPLRRRRAAGGPLVVDGTVAHVRRVASHAPAVVVHVEPVVLLEADDRRPS